MPSNNMGYTLLPAAAAAAVRGVYHAQAHTHLFEKHGHPFSLPRVARMLQEGYPSGVGGGKQSRSFGLVLALEQRLGAHDISSSDARKEVR